uniref:Microtubule-associated protein 4 n=1 Tax=Cyanoderma ruficeps TaxID=181631 RepID=A0A8C3QT70_9PASS
MAHNLSLADALTEPPHDVEEEVKRDFIATLEAEKFDDVVGETVDKTDYVPLLDDEDEAKPGSQEPKSKGHVDGIPVEPEGNLHHLSGSFTPKCLTVKSPKCLTVKSQGSDPRLYLLGFLLDVLTVCMVPKRAAVSAAAEHLPAQLVFRIVESLRLEKIF